MRLSKTHKIGSVIPHGVKPAPHEWETILFFTELGKDVELIMPSNTPYNKNADYSLNTLEKCFKHTRKVRNMYIITKNKELKAYKK